MLDQSASNNVVTTKITLMMTTVCASHHAIKEETRNATPAKLTPSHTQAELIVSAMMVSLLIRMVPALNSRNAQMVWNDRALTQTVSARPVTFLELDAALLFLNAQSNQSGTKINLNANAQLLANT